jgi:hypothetical protein
MPAAAWTCWSGGVQLTEQQQRLAEARRKVMQATGRERADLMAAFRADPVMWLRYCAWTYHVRDVDEHGVERPTSHPDVPFDPWPVQAAAARTIAAAVEQGHDVVLRKSRDMGASWLLCGMAVWGWLLRDWQVLLVSRVEDLVDRTGDPDCLFWKIDYLLETLPAWMLPAPAAEFAKGSGGLRRHLMLQHPRSSATISGQAATAHIGRGGRRNMVVFDEFAALDNAEAAWRSAADCTSCRVAVSTPVGPGTHYATLVAQGRATGTPTLVEMLYTDHPDKSRGGETRVDTDGAITGVAGTEYTWTPWLEQQIGRRDRIDLAINVFAEESSGGERFFAPRDIARQSSSVAVPRRCIYDGGALLDSPSGPWSIYEEPDPAAEYVCGVDPAYGTGAANAAACILNVRDMSVAAEFADPHMGGHDLAAELVRMIRHVYKGRRQTLLGWERNGPGASMQHDVERAGWTHVFKERTVGTIDEARTKRVGWTSTRQSKRALLGRLSTVLSRGEISVPSEDTLVELGDYIVYPDGGVGPGRLRSDTSGAREAHGDRVIALALALLLAEDGGLGPEPTERLPDYSLGAVLHHEEVLHG